ncbi:hypothetical protein PAHAL_2G361000 [Panicum hallii]|uniref:Uncharacterized protein n=1 Tax=Panicum hallii TaxID=206008 RepID=A0A2T8KRK8_9POAL|nr:hypothetical protein PAHAL_2G361000 [Panicum hallii]
MRTGTPPSAALGHGILLPRTRAPAHRRHGSPVNRADRSAFHRPAPIANDSPPPAGGVLCLRFEPFRSTPTPRPVGTSAPRPLSPTPTPPTTAPNNPLRRDAMLSISSLAKLLALLLRGILLHLHAPAAIPSFAHHFFST